MGAYECRRRHAEVVGYKDNIYYGPKLQVPVYVKCEGNQYPVNYIGKQSFSRFNYSNKNADYIDLPNTLISIRDCAFINSLISAIDIGESVDSIQWGAFQGCRNLGAITLPANLKFMGASVFGGAGLRAITVNTKPLESLSFERLFQNHVFDDVLYMYECLVWTNTEENARIYSNLGFTHVMCGNSVDEDVNKDGTVNSLDVLKVYKYMQSH